MYRCWTSVFCFLGIVSANEKTHFPVVKYLLNAFPHLTPSQRTADQSISSGKMCFFQVKLGFFLIIWVINSSEYLCFFYSGYVSCTVSGRRDWRAQYAVTNKNQGAKIREQESKQSVYKGPEAQKQFTHSLGESKQFRTDSMVDSTTVTQGADLELNSPRQSCQGASHEESGDGAGEERC